MARFRGTIRRNDLEGGIWELHADDGERYQVRGGDDGLRRDGLQVEVEGAVDRQAFTIGMTGAVLDVKSWKTVAG